MKATCISKYPYISSPLLNRESSSRWNETDNILILLIYVSATTPIFYSIELVSSDHVLQSNTLTSGYELPILGST